MSITKRIRRAAARVGFYRPALGDVVFDRYDRREKTVETMTDRHLHVVFFADGQARRGTLLRRSATFVR